MKAELEQKDEEGCLGIETGGKANNCKFDEGQPLLVNRAASLTGLKFFHETESFMNSVKSAKSMSSSWCGDCPGNVQLVFTLFNLEDDG